MRTLRAVSSTRRKDARYHVDVFAVTEGVYLDDELVYRDGAWIV